MKVLRCLVMFLTLYLYISFDECISHLRYDACKKDSNLSFIHLCWFNSSNNFVHEYVSLKYDEIPSFSVLLMVSTCICRKNPLEPIFFISPYYENDYLEDLYVYCIPGEPESFGIYDEYEIYNNLLFQYMLQIPNSLMTPLLDDSLVSNDTCLDKDGFPTKILANQKSCMLVINIEENNKIEIYSGPLTVSVLKEYDFDVETFEKCYTSLNDTIHKTADFCVYIQQTSTFLCCCAKEPQKCSFNYTSEVEHLTGKNLFCASNEIMNSKINGKKGGPMLLQEYYKRSVGNSCGIKIYTEFKINDKTQKNESVFKVDYYATNSCEDETVVNITTTKYCATKKNVLKNVEIYKCCKDGHFCNINLTKIDVENSIENRCFFKPVVLLAFGNQNVCESYFDLNAGQFVNLHQHFNVEIRYETMKYMTNNNGVPYKCSYVYGKILKADSSDCRDDFLYDKNALNKLRTFYRCTCEEFHCDKVPGVFILKFKCQQLKDSSFEKITGTEEERKDNWICYIKINDFNEGSQIDAGHFDVNAERNQTKVKECHDNGIFDDPFFCCVNIFNKFQSSSECTTEKQIARFKEYKAKSKEPSESGNSNQNYNHGMDSKHIHCFSKDIENSESEHCPSSDGCFSTRTLQTSETSIEPAGCLGYAEDYTVKNLHATSVSLGCRVGENSNRCSIVQSPDGQQRVVCCCNQNDENGLCNTNLNKVPEKVGKSISSFKNLS